jgi:hypothetical protein
MTHPVPHPITNSDPHEGIIPHLYLIMQRSQHCVCCGSTHTWSELYAQTFMRANWGYGKPITNLRKLDGPPRYNLPIELRATPSVSIPFCHSCNEPTLAHANPPLAEPPPGAKVVIGASTLSQVEPRERAKPKPASKPGRRLTSAQLAELLK